MTRINCIPVADRTLAWFQNYLEYDKKTGKFYRKFKTGNQRKGSFAGTLTKVGYVYLSLHGKKYLAHRLVWLYETGSWPDGHLDHIDGVKHNNVFSNLRLATPSQNAANRDKQVNNKSGYKGVIKKRKRWQASIRVSNKGISLGVYDTPEKASEVYEKTAKEWFGDFYRSVNND
jgi:hypothetical protein